MLIMGKNAISSNNITLFSPGDDTLIGSIAIADDQQIEHALCAATMGQIIARTLSRSERSRILHGAAELVENRKEVFARRISLESGKTYTQALKETDRCVNTLTLSAEEAKRVVGEEIPFDSYGGLDERFGYYIKEPLGIILAITPFNDPINLVAHKVGPAIAAGCACILKPALETPFSALALVECLLEDGLPPECLQVITGDGLVGEQLVRDNRISMISFTGSVKTGEAITRSAGLKRTIMDLGGNAPVFILPDADVETAASECASGAFWAAGQNCIGVQRIFCHESIFDTFKNHLTKKTQSIKTGDPIDPETDMGPMISENAAKRIESWVDEAINEGAKCLIGHKRNGCFYSPTILENVQKTSKVLDMEVFAPVVCLVSFTKLEDALAEANEPDFLLHGAVFTNSLKDVQKICDELQCSGIMINDSSDFRFDGMPFGGSKRGAIGREGVKFAIEEMTQSKTICFKK